MKLLLVLLLASVTVNANDLDNYNFERSWNNSRFWANPENWGKYWW